MESELHRVAIVPNDKYDSFKERIEKLDITITFGPLKAENGNWHFDLYGNKTNMDILLDGFESKVSNGFRDNRND